MAGEFASNIEPRASVRGAELAREFLDQMDRMDYLPKNSLLPPSEMAAMPTRILAIDGGGIRGVIPAMVLVEIERRTNKPVAQLFDYVAGTSTGGILALGLTIRRENGQPKFAAQDMLDFYVKQGAKIFSRSVWHAVAALDNFNGPKYEAASIESVLRECLGEATFGAAGPSRVLVPAYDIKSREPFFFRTYGTKSASTAGLPVWKVARATSAAPTYFPPEALDVGAKPRAFVDGGVFANNPAMCVLVDVLRSKVPLKDIALVSLGTGNLDRSIRYATAKGWGLAGWAHPLIDILMDGVTDTVDHQVRELLGKERHLRVQTNLLPPVDQDLDDAHPGNLQALQAAATRMIAAQTDEITNFCRLLSPP